MYAASCFEALLCNAEVLAKGVQRILHCKSDAYYKCLLCLPAEKLLPLLNNLADYDNAALVLVHQPGYIKTTDLWTAGTQIASSTWALWAHSIALSV